MKIPNAFSTNVRLVVNASAGIQIEECGWNALEVACRERIEVEFIFNDKRYLVKPSDLVTELLDTKIVGGKIWDKDEDGKRKIE